MYFCTYHSCYHTIIAAFLCSYLLTIFIINILLNHPPNYDINYVFFVISTLMSCNVMWWLISFVLFSSIVYLSWLWIYMYVILIIVTHITQHILLLSVFTDIMIDMYNDHNRIRMSWRLYIWLLVAVMRQSLLYYLIEELSSKLRTR